MPRGKKKAVEEPATEQATKFRKVIDNGADELVCPITHELPVDPVTAEDGRVYERSAIEEWLKHHSVSPSTGQPLSSTAIFPNTVLCRLIQHVELCARRVAALQGSTPLTGGHTSE